MEETGTETKYVNPEHYKNLSLEDIIDEEWKNIEGYETAYQISSMGRVKSLGKITTSLNIRSPKQFEGKIRKQRLLNGYLYVNLYSNRKSTDFRVNILVAKSFLPNPENKPIVNHKFDKLDNRKDSLEWVTYKENSLYIFNGNPKGFFARKQVQQIDKKTNEIIKVWKSVTSAAIELKLHGSSISLAATGKLKTTGGFMWRYINDAKSNDSIFIEGEVWKKIKTYENYEISTFGRIRTIKKQNIRKQMMRPDKYMNITLFGDGIFKTFSVHRLVAENFIENPENKPIVNHKNGIRSDNNIGNLEWTTYRENSNHMHVMGFDKHPRGENAGKAKLTEDDVRKIRELLKNGVQCSKIARIYNVNKSTILAIKNGKTWRHVL